MQCSVYNSIDFANERVANVKESKNFNNNSGQKGGEIKF